MHRYLPEVQADYELEMLDIPPQDVLVITGSVAQEVHEFDDGSQAVVERGDQHYFDVELKWDYLSKSDWEYVTDLWHNPHKARGFKNTFYWAHPTDDHIYTVRFLSQLRNQERPASIRSIASITLRVIGIKPTWE